MSVIQAQIVASHIAMKLCDDVSRLTAALRRRPLTSQSRDRLVVSLIRPITMTRYFASALLPPCVKVT